MYNLRSRKTKSSSPQSAESSSKEVAIPKRPKLGGPAEMSKLDELPPEILIKIFEFLKPSDIHNKIALVCRKFFELTKSPELNRKVCFFGDSDSKAVNTFLKQRGQHIRKLEFCYIENTPGLVKTAARVCDSLKWLRLWDDISHKVLKDLCSGDIFPHLSELHLYNQTFDDETMALLLENRHKCLRSLVTSTCHIEDESLKNLGLCTQLETLDVGHLSFDSMKGIAEMSQLNDLELNMLFLTSNNFVEIFRVGAFPQLESLILNGCLELTDEGFRAILRSAPNLGSLKLCSCDKLTANFATELTQSDETFPNLNSLYLEKMSVIPSSKKFLYGIVSVFPTLYYLNLKGTWSNVSDSHFIKAVRKSPSGKTLMIVTESRIFADRETTIEELDERKSDNRSWDFDEYDEPKIVPC